MWLHLFLIPITDCYCPGSIDGLIVRFYLVLNIRAHKLYESDYLFGISGGNIVRRKPPQILSDDWHLMKLIGVVVTLCGENPQMLKEKLLSKMTLMKGLMTKEWSWEAREEWIIELLLEWNDYLMKEFFIGWWKRDVLYRLLDRAPWLTFLTRLNNDSIIFLCDYMYF